MAKKNKNSTEETDIKSSLSVLAEHCCLFASQHFSPYSATFTPPHKGKSNKGNPGHQSKACEKDEFKFIYRPVVQIFKPVNPGNYENKILKKPDLVSSVAPVKRSLYVPKNVNKVFRHNAAGTDSVRSYRELNVYSRVGKVIRKQLERAIDMFNALKEEAEQGKKTVVRRATIKKDKDSVFGESKSAHRNIQSSAKIAANQMKNVRDTSESKKPLTSAPEFGTESLSITQPIVNNKPAKNIEIPRINKKSEHNNNKFIILDEKQKMETVKRQEPVKPQSLKDMKEKKQIILEAKRSYHIEKKLPKLDNIRTRYRKVKEKIPLPITVLNISLPPILNQENSLQKETETSNHRFFFRDYSAQQHSNQSATNANDSSQFKVPEYTSRLKTKVKNYMNLASPQSNNRTSDNNKYLEAVNINKEKFKKRHNKVVNYRCYRDGHSTSDDTDDSLDNKFTHTNYLKRIEKSLKPSFDFVPKYYSPTSMNQLIEIQKERRQHGFMLKNKIKYWDDKATGSRNGELTPTNGTVTRKEVEQQLKMEGGEPKNGTRTPVSPKEFLIEKSLQTLRTHEQYMQRHHNRFDETERLRTTMNFPRPFV